MSSSYRPKLAAVVTTYFKYSHAQHIVDRFLDGYGWNGAHHYPPMDLVSLYVDQVGQNDLSRERANRHPTMKTCPSIAEALTLGGSKLAVDGVVLVAEHGNYPRNEKGQTQYPRHEFFEEIVKVFRATGHSVPVFNDKHLSWNWEWARQMFDTSRELRFAFMAGSSLPVTWRIPSVEMPLGSRVGEAVCVCYGGVDSYDFSDRASEKPCASATAAWTATTFTVWRPSNAWSNGGAAARPASSGYRHIAETSFGTRCAKASGPGR